MDGFWPAQDILFSLQDVRSFFFPGCNILLRQVFQFQNQEGEERVLLSFKIGGLLSNRCQRSNNRSMDLLEGDGYIASRKVSVSGCFSDCVYFYHGLEDSV
jgi:hypothetical protein